MASVSVLISKLNLIALLTISIKWFRIHPIFFTFFLKNLRNHELWSKKEMHSICLIKTKEDISPIRMEYSGQAKNIGINYLTSDKEIWYTIQDVIASKILTGKSPEIIKAITFHPDSIQAELKDVNIYDITINKDENFIRKVIEERIKIKKEKPENWDQLQLILKIIANATSYGIYIEENQETIETKMDIKVYSTEQFTYHTDNIERIGEYFNPIMATLITSSARLILAIAEYITESNGYIAYCDTDSVFVKPEIVKQLQEFFKTLNPYSIETEMFKIEEDDEKKPLDNVLFYGISAKRYCLYDNFNNIRKYSSHGLGHLKDIDSKEVWKSILTNNYNYFNNKIAVSQITASKPSILKRFKKMNENKELNKKIKPYNFILAGNKVENVIPCLPYSKNIYGIQYNEFIDYRSGKSSNNLDKPTIAYWKSLDNVLTQYVKHNDNKFDYIEGIAQRKHIYVNKIRYIGKESNNLDETEIFGIDDNSYIEYVNDKEFTKWILTLKPKDVKSIGIQQRELIRIKNKVKNNERLNPNTKVVKQLYELYKKYTDQ
ncbi:hypothetical protein OXIME_001228 [Oxyplasma meridianum]|uniref:DNA-directed DNA polymerase n=1 Tax=Oxyplasma meridianum TaxID=3073602 RepID=A0AAX4NIH0_9ARCH